jgi:thiamine-phosphate pyrophosphorylase
MERAVYRIIDANFNRGREALRVMEDVCRFYLNSMALSSRAKQLRHELSSAVGQLNAGMLLASRDTPGDVGTEIRVDNQLSRRNLEDCLTAAGKRASEALRCLSEAAQTINPAVAKCVEQVRYSCYTLEKDVALAMAVRPKMLAVQLYVLVSSSNRTDILRLALQCCRGGARCLQLRAKDLPGDELFGVAAEFVRICRDMNVISIINDRIDVAIASGADGVHLGQNDLPVSAARRLQVSPLIVGKSTHKVSQLRSAIDEGADYVGLGPVFPTETKPGIEIAGLDYVRAALPIAAEAGIAAVAIGGITLGNVGQVTEVGARAVAVSGAIINSADPESACKCFISKVLGGMP